VTVAARRCRDCDEVKPGSHFYRHPRDGVLPYCKPCKAARLAAWRSDNPDRAHRQRQREHGMAPGTYDAMLASQGGVCATCHRPGADTRLQIDHDHRCCPGRTSCGKCVRGLLCARCNILLGRLRDDRGFLLRLVAYLETSETQPPAKE
jgi:hypothetical protein